MKKEDIEIYKMLKSKKRRLEVRFFFGVMAVFLLLFAFVINTWLGVAVLVGWAYFLYDTIKKWNEFEDEAITLGYDITAWGDLKRIE